MPITYWIDREHRVVISRAWGEFTDAELRTHYVRLASDRALDRSFAYVTDLRDVTHFVATNESIRSVAISGPFRAGQRRAIVAATPAQLGVARIFATYVATVGGTIQVFRSWAEAVAWLGVEGGLEPLD